jgi:hypothetical protein
MILAGLTKIVYCEKLNENGPKKNHKKTQKYQNGPKMDENAGLLSV